MFFTSGKKKKAKELFSEACKVYDFRRDLMPVQDAESLRASIDSLDEMIDDGKVGTREYENLARELEKQMSKWGGKIYPLSFWADNVDMIIVAGILALGIRSFFLQPFKIPTNSMYPSFYGMTSQVYTEESPEPPAYLKPFRWTFSGASNYSVKSPKSGELFIEIAPQGSLASRSGCFDFTPVDAMEYLVWPSQHRKYKFIVDGEEVPLEVPIDFSLDGVIPKAFPIGEAKDISEYMVAAGKEGRIIRSGPSIFLKLGDVKKGDKIINFDILSGDMLFVDRFTYNFRRPKIGDAIVFRTKYCEGLRQYNGGREDDKYYIKRLVGESGDRLRVEGSTLMRNGKPIEGSEAFGHNAKKEGLYCGYMPEGDLQGGAEVVILPEHYYAMGDNSANSLDSRYWGQVPKQALVGKSLIIFYPFTERWGASK